MSISNAKAVGKNYIFAIGINNYKFISRLGNPVKDVDDVIEQLVSRYEFAYENVIKLTDENATRNGILTELQRLCEELKENDNLIFFYAGHGESRLDTGYLVPFDAAYDSERKIARISDCITYNDLIGLYFKAIKVRHLFVIIDACHSGLIFEVEGAVRGRNAAVSRYAITSGREERVSDGKKGKNSPFSSALISALSENNVDITVPVLCEQVIKKLGNSKANHGQLKGIGHKNYTFILERKISQDTYNDWSEAKTVMTESALKVFKNKYPKSIFDDKLKRLIRLSRPLEKGIDEFDELEQLCNEFHESDRDFFTVKTQQLNHSARTDTKNGQLDYEALYYLIEVANYMDNRFGLNFMAYYKMEREKFESHTVEVKSENGHEFLIMKNLVSISEFKAYTEIQNEDFPAIIADADNEDREEFHFREEDPIRDITWFEADKYAKWLNLKLGLTVNGYRLPKKEEWNKAESFINVDGKIYEWCQNDKFIDEDNKEDYSNEELNYPTKVIIRTGSESFMKPEQESHEVGFRLLRPIKQPTESKTIKK